MNVIVNICNMDGSSEHDEEMSFPGVKDDDAVWDAAQAIIDKFNRTLRTGEKPRKIIAIYENEGDVEEHTPHQWEKSNLVTILDRHGSYDTMRCSVCGATGKRYGLGTTGIHIDAKFQKRQYCPGK